MIEWLLVAAWLVLPGWALGTLFGMGRRPWLQQVAFALPVSIVAASMVAVYAGLIGVSWTVWTANAIGLLLVAAPLAWNLWRHGSVLGVRADHVGQEPDEDQLDAEQEQRPGSD